MARWAAVLGRPAPDPTETSEAWLRARQRRLYGPHRLPVGRRGSLAPFLIPAQRLSPRFVEWMMGLPAGWVVDVPGIGRNDALRLLGNGVVPQQAAVAVASLLAFAADATAPPSVADEGAA